MGHGWTCSTALILVISGVAACSGSGPGHGPVIEPTPGPAATTSEYLPGLAADVRVPEAGEAPSAVVVLIPGGGWQTADRSGLSPLAGALTEKGFLTVNATYRAGVDGATFPTPLDDVRCAIGFAAGQAAAAGAGDAPIIVLGHSAGGHLAALAALAAPGSAAGCPYRIPPVAGLVGLAGVYDTAAFEFALVELFGTTRSEDPEMWRRGDPIAQVESGGAATDLRVLLLHGDADTDVPVTQSQAFANALEAAGIDVELDVLAGVTHQDVYASNVAGPPVTAWIDQLVAPSADR